MAPVRPCAEGLQGVPRRPSLNTAPSGKGHWGPQISFVPPGSRATRTSCYYAPLATANHSALSKFANPSSVITRCRFFANPRYRTFADPKWRLRYKNGCSTFALTDALHRSANEASHVFATP